MRISTTYPTEQRQTGFETNCRCLKSIIVCLENKYELNYIKVSNVRIFFMSYYGFWYYVFFLLDF